uniref:CUB domain-containing protein n=1 Tax=Romanomermis culicivorax TaxID=13658 RepID=A0A915KGK1_ROMCU
MTGPELRDARSDPQAERVTFCSPMDEPQLKSFYSSSASRMIMIFKSNESVGQGFEARVRFRTDFGIVGTKVAKNSELCHFEFKNDEENRERNSFNSPRFPDDYFSNTTCIYDIKAPENRRIYIEFEQFDLHQPYPPEENNAGGDRLEIFDAFKNNRTFRLYANYSSLWSGWVPGPTISRSNWVRVVFHSDARGTKTGFKAYYKFLPLRNDGQECETPVGPTLDEPKGTVTEHPVCADLRSGATAGSILSPNFGSKYDAGLDRLWIIKARKGYRVLLEPVVLKVEGKMKPDGTYDIFTFLPA